MRWTLVAALVLMAAVAGAAIAQQAPAPAAAAVAPAAGPAARAHRPTAPRARPGERRTGQRRNPQQMIDMLGKRLGLTEAESAATKRAARAKMEAAAPLRQELRTLDKVARNHQATDQEVSAALERFDAALATYRQKVQAIDGELMKAVSLKARAALTAIGIIDNGMGLRLGGARMPGGGKAQVGARRMRGSGARGFGGRRARTRGPRVVR